MIGLVKDISSKHGELEDQMGKLSEVDWNAEYWGDFETSGNLRQEPSHSEHYASFIDILNFPLTYILHSNIS